MMQEQRFTDPKEIHCNAQMTTKLMLEHCKFPGAGDQLIKTALENWDFLPLPTFVP
jgi:hypothetical protein